MTRLSFAEAIALLLTHNRAFSQPFYTDVLVLTLQSQDDFAAV